MLNKSKSKKEAEKDKLQKIIDPGLQAYWSDQTNGNQLFKEGYDKLKGLDGYKMFQKSIQQCQAQVLDPVLQVFQSCLISGHEYEQVEACFVNETASDSTKKNYLPCMRKYDKLFIFCWDKKVLPAANEFFKQASISLSEQNKSKLYSAE